MLANQMKIGQIAGGTCRVNNNRHIYAENNVFRLKSEKRDSFIINLDNKDMIAFRIVCIIGDCDIEVKQSRNTILRISRELFIDKKLRKFISPALYNFSNLPLEIIGDSYFEAIIGITFVPDKYSYFAEFSQLKSGHCNPPSRNCHRCLSAASIMTKCTSLYKLNSESALLMPVVGFLIYTSYNMKFKINGIVEYPYDFCDSLDEYKTLSISGESEKDIFAKMARVADWQKLPYELKLYIAKLASRRLIFYPICNWSLEKTNDLFAKCGNFVAERELSILRSKFQNYIPFLRSENIEIENCDVWAVYENMMNCDLGGTIVSMKHGI